MAARPTPARQPSIVFRMPQRLNLHIITSTGLSGACQGMGFSSTMALGLYGLYYLLKYFVNPRVLRTYLATVAASTFRTQDLHSAYDLYDDLLDQSCNSLSEPGQCINC